MRYILENKEIKGIPVLELYPVTNNPEKSPLVLLLHGFLGCKEDKLQDAYLLAREGFFTVSFDAWLHGELETPEFQALSYFEKAGRFFEIIMRTSPAINTLIGAYDQHPSADNRSAGLFGTSMGGMTVYHYLFQEGSPKVKAAVPVIATPEWSVFLKKNLENTPELARSFDEDKMARLENRQPVNNLSQLRDFPLLILNTELDDRMPVESVRRFFRRLREQYSRPELVQMIEYPGIGHERTPEMLVEAVGWFKKYLKD